MTDDRGGADWSDDRLAAAFAARSDGRSARGDLVSPTVGRLRAEPRPEHRRVGITHLGGAAAAAVVLAVVAVGVFGPRPTTEPGDTNASTFGLDPITVSEAIAIRDAGVDDREIAVSGYFVTAGPIRCRADTSGNPARSWCPGLLAWIMEEAQPIDVSAVRSSGATPTGPAIQSPGLALVHPSGLPPTPGVVTPVTFIGHFDDRRAAFCTADERTSCADTFVVDRVAAINGQDIRTTAVLDVDAKPQSTGESIDQRVRGVASDVQILSQRVTTIGQLGASEPLFAGRRGSPSYLQSIHWLVTVLPPVDSAGRTVVRTFLIPDDGTDPILEITRDGEFPVTATISPSPDTPAATPATSQPATEEPESVHGIPVISVSDALARSRLPVDDAELAVRGWYVPPIDPFTCATIPPGESPIAAFCPRGYAWLLEEPERLEDPASHERHAPVGPALNPLVERTVPFDLPSLLLDPGAEPVPVVVLGHFGDRRARLADEARRFVVDALVWRAGADARQDPVIIAEEVESELAAIRDTVASKVGSSVATWVAVVPGPELATIDPDAPGSAPELVEADAVWIVRSLVERGSRPVLRTAYVPDGTDRVWLEMDEGWFELATTIDIPVGPAEGGTVVARVADLSRLLDGARRTIGDDLTGAVFIHRPGTEFAVGVDVADVPDHPAEIIVSWIGGACDRTWRLSVFRTQQTGTVQVYPVAVDADESCRLGGIRRSVVLQFSEPITAAEIEVLTNTSGG